MDDYFFKWFYGDRLSGFGLGDANGFGDGYEGNSIGSGHGCGIDSRGGNGFESGAGYSASLKDSIRKFING
jgi:hypothetical protein